jgi:sterol desaturase/sphingolipid hydroxylase (fatty acid hydroxylase superfamily)
MGLWILGYGLLIAVAERIFPYSVPRLRMIGTARAPAARFARNISFAAINLFLSSFMVNAIGMRAALWSLRWRPHGIPEHAGLALDLLLLDFWIYAWHRIVHAFPWTWRFHEPHHLDEHVDSTTALRFHCIDIGISAAARGVMIVIFDIDLWHVFIFELATVAFSLFHHSNLRLPAAFERFLSWVIVTPSFHWIHHHPTRRVHDSNYGTILSLWDRLLGTCSATRRHPGMSLGVEGRPDEGVLSLLVMPFLLREGRATVAVAVESPLSGESPRRNAEPPS